MTTNSVTRPGLGRWATRLVATKKKSSKGTAKVTVSTSATSKPTGTVNVLGSSKTIAKGELASKNKGVIKIKLPKLKKGKHTLTVSYAGTDKVKASSKVLQDHRQVTGTTSRRTAARSTSSARTGSTRPSRTCTVSPSTSACSSAAAASGPPPTS